MAVQTIHGKAKAKRKLWPWLLGLALIYGGVRLGVPAINHQVTAKKYLAAEGKFAWGTLEPTAGPYAKEGNPKDLKFEVVDLGLAKSGEMSETGDVLIQSLGIKPIEYTYTDTDGVNKKGISTPNSGYLLRRKNGDVQKIEPCVKAFITPRGVVYTVRETMSDKFNFSKDGKLFYTSPKEWDRQLNYSEGGVHFFGDEVICLESNTNQKCLDAHTGKVTELPIPKDQNYSSLAGSTYWTMVGKRTIDEAMGNWSYDVIAVRGNKVTKVPVPFTDEQPILTPAGKAIYIWKSFSSSDRRIVRWTEETRDFVPMPKGIINYSVEGANERGDVLIVGTFNDPRRITKGDFPHSHREFLLSNGFAYPIDEIFGDRFKLVSYDTRRNIVDADGNFLLLSQGDDGQHLFLARRRA